MKSPNFAPSDIVAVNELYKRPDPVRCSASAKKTIHKSYLVYYGRCAERSGFEYWCKRLDAEGVSLGSIISAFGTSKEYTKKYENRSDAHLIHSLYQNGFDRNAEDKGLNFYLKKLAEYRTEWKRSHNGDSKGSTEYALSRIALDVILGAHGNDINTLNKKIGNCSQW